MSHSSGNPPPEEPHSTPPPQGGYPPPQGSPQGPPPGGPSQGGPPPGSYPQGDYQPGMAPPPPMQSAPGVGQPADLGPRFVARLIDYVLLVVANIILGIVVVTAMMGSDAGVGGFGADDYGPSLVSTLISTVITLGYFALLESSRGQTVGKMAMKLETRGANGGRPSMEEALKRNAFTAIGIIGVIPILGAILSPILSLVAVIMIAVTISNNTATRQGWHDKFAGGTTVVKIG
jgi:uncharacterized RDD family membrane protein YckC